MDLFQYLKPLNLFADLSSQALICCHEKCKRAIAVGRGRPTSHLAGHGIPLSERAELTKLLNAIDLENPDNLIPLEDGSLAIPQLRLYNGYICRKCNTRTIDLQLIKKHNPLYGKGSCPEQGIDPNTPSDSHIEYVYLQTWAPIHNRRYWIVEHNGTTIRPAGGQPAQDHTESVQKREIERSRKFGDSNNHMLCFAEQSPWLERTGWEGMLRGRDREVLSAMIEVPRQQGGQPHVLLRRDPDCQEDDVISTSEDEQKIAAILNLVNPMMDRCEQTARSTSRNILCWVRSVKPLSPSPEPFQLLRQPDSTRKYRYLHRRLLAFVLRAYRLDPDVRRRLTKIHMSAKILRLLDSLWQNQYWDSDGQQTSCAIPSTIVNCDSINLDLDEEVSKIDYMNDRGNNENDDENVYENNRGDNENDDESDDESGDEDDDDENDDENDDRSNLESERDSNDNYDESQFAGSGHIEVDSNITADAQSDSACFPAFHTTNAQRCVDEALELLFGLSVALFEERPINERRDSMLAVLFSGILGFSKTRQSFLQARDFTTHLSALIYNQRLVLLERALPVRPYPKLGIECRPRRNQLQQLNKVRKRFLVAGSASSFDEFFSLRNYGRVAAQSDSPSFLLHWSDDGQSVWWKDSSPLSMSQFRQLSRQLIREAESLCDELMYGLEPTINLGSIKDDMTNKQQGYSFVSDPANNLHHAYLKLCNQACTAVNGSLSHKGHWKWKAVDKYLKTERRFRIVVRLIMQETGGQAARWSELLSLLCQNSEFGQRGLFAFKSYIIYITRHHKAKRSTNREHIVARFLPAGPSQILYKYLAYIRPFVDLLQRERYQSGLESGSEILSGPQLLFRNQSEPSSKAWSTSRFNDALKRETQKVWGQSVNSRIMRQLRIGITEKHVREIYQPFNRYDDKGPNASRNAIFAHQSGHRPRQRGSNYGLDGAFPTTLQPQLLELYEWASLRWHEFLQLPSQQTHRSGDNTERVATDNGTLEASKRHNSYGSAASSTVIEESEKGLELNIRTLRLKRKLPHSWTQQPVGYYKSQIQQATSSDVVSPHPKRISYEHATNRMLTDKTDTVGIHPQISPLSLPLPLPLSYAKDDRDGLITSAGTPLTDEPLLSERQEPNTHLHLIPRRNLAMLYDTQKELHLFNTFLHKYLALRQTHSSMHLRLSRVIQTTKWWSSIGCPLCFLCGETEAKHTVHACKRNDLRKKTLSIIAWLEDLRIPEYTSKAEGSCSICLSFYACEEATTRTLHPDSVLHRTRDSNRDLVMNSRCEVKPIIHMAIASLAAYDSQIFRNMLSKVPLTTDAEVWFERRIPHNGHWFSNLLLAYEELMMAFYYRHNRRRGLDPLCGFPSHPPAPELLANQVIDGAYLKWDTEEEVTSWKAIIEWWEGKCSLCVGHGLSGQDIQHTLRQCTRGGSQMLRSELADAMYAEKIVPNYGCNTCHLPYDFCDDWARMGDGEWVTFTTAKGVLCQFGRHLLCDTIIGLYHCGKRHLMDEFQKVAYEYSLKGGLAVTYDETTIALALSQQVIVTNVVGSQLLRTLVVLTNAVLYEVNRDKGN